MNLEETIVRTPDTCCGHSRIVGHRITVDDVWFSAWSSVHEDYPQLTSDEVKAALFSFIQRGTDAEKLEDE